MEFLKNIKRQRSFVHELFYVVLNVLLVIILMIIIKTTNSVWLAFTVVLLSKWRVFAVRPRYWFANIQADLVSLIVSLSYVIFIYSINISDMSNTYIWIAQIFWSMMFMAWLIFVKSGAKRNQIVGQAGIALFMGITAIYTISYDWIASGVVILVWLVGYAVARHVLSSYDEESHIRFLSTVWGLFLAEMGWLAYHWTIAYDIPAVLGIMLPQVSIITLCFSFLAYKAYDSNYHYKKIRFHDIALPLIFTIAITAVLIFGFNGVNTSTI